MMRRLRGILRTALTWSMAWSIPGVLWIGWITFFRTDGAHFGVLSFAWNVLLNWSFAGAINGAIFAIAVSIAERRTKSIDALSMRRIVGLGIVGGALLPVFLLPIYFRTMVEPVRFASIIVAINAVLSATFAAGTLALARRARTNISSIPDATLLSPTLATLPAVPYARELK